jgi:D-alanyl-D-alanine carboxypeptidase (penicillin-binding protein 5/6)
LLLIVVVAGLRLLASTDALPTDQGNAGTEVPPSGVWPVHGQAAYVQAGHREIQAGPNQHAAPIASVAKVMTAYLVLRDHPLRVGDQGPAIAFTAADVADTERRRAQGESVVAIAAGERLTERQALQALLLPSANNVAAALARWDAGSERRFVARMNATARALRMTRTRYTDPSGLDDGTVSTAADQVRIVVQAMRLETFASIVATPSAVLPVAGVVHSTNTLLGHDGFIGVKTGSDDAAGGCFAFRAVRWVNGRRAVVTGVVLGQPGRDQIGAGLAAGEAMVDRIAGFTVRGRRKSPQPPRSRLGVDVTPLSHPR